MAALLLIALPTSAVASEELPVAASPDATRPSVAGLKLAPTSFRPAGSGPSIVSGRRGGVGTKVSFDLSEAGRIDFSVEEKKVGRRVGGICRSPSASNDGKPGCVRFVAIPGSFSVVAGEGINAIFFSGRVGGRTLAPAGYRLNALVRDGAGNESLPGNAEFSVLAR